MTGWRSGAAVAVAVAVAVGSSSVDAQTAAPRILTLDEALAMARRANRSLVVERARVAEARTNVEQAWTVLFPTVTAQGKYTRNYKEADLDFGALFKSLGVTTMTAAGTTPADLDVTILKQNQLDASVNATLPLIVPAAYPALNAVNAAMASSEASYEASQASVLLGVAQAFYLAAAADDVLISRRSNIDVDRATLGNAQTRFTAGTVTKVDVDRAELALVRAQQAEREAVYAREQAYRALATLIQAEGPFEVRAPEPPTAADAPADLDAALHLRPEFRALTLTVNSAESTEHAYAWRWSPQLSAFGNAHIGNYVGFTGDKYSWAVGLQLDWTLYDGGLRDVQRHLAAAQAVEAEARAQVLTDQIRDDLDNNRRLLDTKRQALTASTRALALAQETLDLVRSQYEAGTVTQVDLLQAQDNLVGAQEALAQSRFDVSVADVTLRRAAGTFPGK
jgi:outer membrane protein TolC